ncbi:hypothetical protein [Alkalimonas mucilaginosa]|uniref:Uncharacterized protein n=1 Tax=Alkalimonas mucilaginosa TaxID=3057676 RepID=A0ABU7JEM0_9GAMM|nr:hypothetical protein [Alkalimonas sp. MEB004]MEE2023605.1 hypothetical protein [Alkalimonas sp. MEB004]
MNKMPPFLGVTFWVSVVVFFFLISVNMLYIAETQSHFFTGLVLLVFSGILAAGFIVNSLPSKFFGGDS